MTHAINPIDALRTLQASQGEDRDHLSAFIDAVAELESRLDEIHAEPEGATEAQRAVTANQIELTRHHLAQTVSLMTALTEQKTSRLDIESFIQNAPEAPQATETDEETPVEPIGAEESATAETASGELEMTSDEVSGVSGEEPTTEPGQTRYFRPSTAINDGGEDRRLYFIGEEPDRIVRRNCNALKRSTVGLKDVVGYGDRAFLVVNPESGESVVVFAGEDIHAVEIASSQLGSAHELMCDEVVEVNYAGEQLS